MLKPPEQKQLKMFMWKIAVPYGSMLHIPPTNYYLLAAKQESYQNVYLVTKNIEEFSTTTLIIIMIIIIYITIIGLPNIGDAAASFDWIRQTVLTNEQNKTKKEKNCRLFLDIISSAIMNDLTRTFTSRLN